MNETAAALQAVVQAYHFVVMQVHMESDVRDDAGHDERYAQG